jgi:hypothetical protein
MLEGNLPLILSLSKEAEDFPNYTGWGVRLNAITMRVSRMAYMLIVQTLTPSGGDFNIAVWLTW